MLLILALMSVLCCGWADFQVKLLVTTEVRGAVFPFDGFGTECSFASWNTTPCTCFGGAARRQTVLAEAFTNPDVVAIDTGAYFFGSGLAFPSFRGSANSDLFAHAGYKAFSLTHRDFHAGISASDPTGGIFLSQYLNQLAGKRASLLPAVATNLDISNDPHLTAAHVAPYKIVSLSNGRRLALLSLLDPTPMDLITPHYAQRLLPFDRALEAVLVQLRRSPAGMPESVVLAVGGIPDALSDLEMKHAQNDRSRARLLALQKLTEERTGIDAVLFWGIGNASGPLHRKNWAGDDVLMVPVGREVQGRQIDEITMHLGNTGLLRGALSTRREVQLVCAAQGGPSHDAAVTNKLISYHSTMQTLLQRTKGYLQGPGEGRPLFPTSSSDCLKVGTAKFCGCRVAQCGAGVLIADAVQWLSGANVSLIPSGGIRSSFTTGAVTTAHALAVQPLLNELVLLNKVPGSALRAALLNSISQLGRVTPAQASGRFLQVSSTLRFEWYFEGNDPKLGAVHIGQIGGSGQLGNFVLLDDTAWYTVATTSFLANGGDDYDMLKSLGGRVCLGKAGHEAVAEYLSAVAPTTPGYDLGSSTVPLRIAQTPSVTRLQLGSLCRAKDETCDVVRHMVAAINDKHDGFFDDLLKHAVIEVNETIIGCSQGLAQSGYHSIHQALPNMTAAIGPFCSNDAQDLSNAAWRNAAAVPTLFLAQSTAPTLRDDSAYPYLVRTQSPDTYKTQGFGKMFEHFGWKRLGVLHDTSLWASNIANLVMSDPHVSVLNAGTESFSLQDFDSGTLSAENVLGQLAAGTRIIFLATQLRVQRKIFEAVYTTKKFYGHGYGWVSGWTNEKMLMNIDGTVNAKAVKGAEGLLGLVGHIDSQGAVRKKYLQLWGAASSKTACTGGATLARPFCDNDGDGSTLSPSGSFQADSVLLYAKAMDAIYQTGQFDSIALEQTMLNLSPFDSISGTMLSLDGHGDRVGAFEIENLQIDHSGIRRLRGDPTRHLYVSLTSTTAAFKTVGRFDVVQGLSLYSTSVVIFPGHVQNVPLDRETQANQIINKEEGLGTTTVVFIILGVCMLAIILICAYWYYSHRRLRALKVELEQFKEAIVGVRVVHKNYLPDASTTAWAASPSAPSVPFQMRPRSCWYWAEDESRLSAHNPHEVFQPGNFVKYAGSVCAELEEYYLNFLAGDGSALHRLNLVDRIASTGTERKSFAEDSGYSFEVDFNTMKQMNLKTKYARAILRVEAPQPKVDAPAVSTAWQVHARTGSRISAFPEDTCKLQRPTELMTDDALQLHIGQLIQTSKQRPDGWSYGSVIYDEIEDRKAPTGEGISTMAGWFPLECTSVPTTTQLEKLQARMGGVDALAAPSYWQPVKDPLEAQLFGVAGPERQQVVDAFMQTLDASKVQVVKVERIENMTLWQSFAVKRQTVVQREKDPSSASNLERIWLFHGTTEEIVPKIVQQGFNRSFCGRNATMYGKGVYFARDSSYSASRAYSKPDAQMVQRMFLCRVVVGEYCRGVKDGIAPNVRSGHMLYDTTVDNVKDPSIYVTYHDAQAYPEYLVHFKQA